MVASFRAIQKFLGCNGITVKRQICTSINQCMQKEAPRINNIKESCEVEEAEPSYDSLSEETIIYSNQPFKCEHGGVLPELHVAYESWGELNANKDNVVLVQHGLSGSTHARSHLENDLSVAGWWEKFIGPGLSIDTDKFFVICANSLGSCFGTTGPGSINPITQKHYGGDFPIISVGDIVNSQFILLNALGINKLHAVVGASLGGLTTFMTAALYSQHIDRIVSISGGGSSPPSAIAYRYLQRVALMNDPKWKNGHYYESEFPLEGAVMARKIATLTYRSGPEWSERFKTKKVSNVSLPRYRGTEFMIEDYIKHQSESFIKRTKYDPNSLIYLSKAMDIFDIGEGFSSMEEGFSRIKSPTLVMGASSDVLYPATHQQQAADHIKRAGNPNVLLKISEGKFGHDTFLLDVDGMGSHMKAFLES